MRHYLRCAPAFFFFPRRVRPEIYFFLPLPTTSFFAHSIPKMPPKKATAAPAAKKSAKAADTKATKPASKATSKAAPKTAPKAASAGRGRPKKMSTEEAKPSKKESAETAKKTKSTTSTSTAASKKRKADEAEEKPREPKKPRVIAQPRATKAKAVKEKVVINKAPTTRLNVYVCGEGSSGELGLGTAKNVIDVKRPRLNPLLPADKVGVVQVAVGGMHCIALTHDNKILSWGVNDQGALGRDTAWDGGYKDMDDNQSDSDSDDEDSGLNPHESTPTAIPASAFPKDTVFSQVAAGDSSSFAVTDDGQVYGWGTFRVNLT